MRFINVIKAIAGVGHGGEQEQRSASAVLRRHQGSGASGRRQMGGVIAWGRAIGWGVGLGAVLAGCASGEKQAGTVEVQSVSGAFLGVVAADEPRAALVGREILAAGGTAADAAVAMGFALSVTLPSSAGLGGGGACVVWDGKEQAAQALDFLPRAPERQDSAGGYQVALPGLVRGMFALQSRHGALRWEQVVVPAEGLARFGVRTSRALAGDISVASAALMREPGTMRVFARRGTQRLVGEGDRLEQLDLSAVLGRLRTHGAGDFYAGGTAARYLEAVHAGGGALDPASLRDYAPRWEDPVAVKAGDHTAYFAPPPAAAGLLAADMFAMLAEDDRFEDADADERLHLLAEVSTRGHSDRMNWMRRDGTSVVAPSRITFPARIKDAMTTYDRRKHTPASSLTPPPKGGAENPAMAGLVAVDGDGMAVTCSLTLGNPFGIGRMAQGTGILPAAVPDVAGRGYLALGPVLVANPNTGKFYWAGTAAGGITAPTSLVAVAARQVLGGADLKTAMTAKRVHTTGDPDILYYEQGVSEAAIKALSDRGHRLGATQSLGRVVAASCPEEGVAGGQPCLAMSDPRGHGLALDAR